MIQKGYYQETLSRLGDCAVKSRNFLKYLKKNGGAAGFKPFTKKTFFPKFSTC
jgi:hypothetical protein